MQRSFVRARTLFDSVMKFVLPLSNEQSTKRDGGGRVDCEVQTIGDTDLHCCNYITHDAWLTILTLLRNVCFRDATIML